MDTLPHELILEIVSYYQPITKLKDPNDVLEEYNLVKNTLASLCLVSRSWRDIAQPLLYRTYIKTEKTDIGIDHDEYNEAKIDAMEAQGMDIATIPEEEFEYTGYRKPIPLEKFIRTMIERPDLAEQVQCLSISNYWDENADRPYAREDVNKALGEAMYHASLKVPPQKTPWKWRYPAEWQESWRTELREGDELAEVALLMVLLPNIRVLDLGTSSETYGSYVHDLWRQSLGSQSKRTLEHLGMEMEVHENFLSQSETPMILSQLECFSARVDISTYENAPNIDIVKEILTIPTLKEFYCWGLEQPSCEDLCLPLAHLRQVYLDDCRVSEDALVCILDSCKQLEFLGVVFSGWSEWTQVELGMELLVALTERKETLKRLTLILPPLAKERNPNLFIQAPFDLRGLTNLEILSIDYEIIFSERESESDEDARENVKYPYNLPESLKRLKIQYCRLDEDMASCASYLFDAGTKQKYEKLKFMQVTYETFDPQNDLEKDQILSLSCVSGIFKALGMELKVVSEDGSLVGPHPAFGYTDAAKKYRRDTLNPGGSESDDWEDMDSDDDDIDNLDYGHGDGDEEDNDNDRDTVDRDRDDEMVEDTQGEEQGRYNLRPR